MYVFAFAVQAAAGAASPRHWASVMLVQPAGSGGSGGAVKGLGAVSLGATLSGPQAVSLGLDGIAVGCWAPASGPTKKRNTRGTSARSRRVKRYFMDRLGG